MPYPYDDSKIYIKEKGANCPICGGEHVKDDGVVTSSYFVYAPKKPTRKIEVCQNCGVHTTSPQKRGGDT
jgi:ribosomal protein S27AE